VRIVSAGYSAHPSLSLHRLFLESRDRSTSSDKCEAVIRVCLYHDCLNQWRIDWAVGSPLHNEMAPDSGELMALSGPRNPYPGKLGVIEEGALADLLLVEGNPLENIELLKDPENKLMLIMKDGKIYKNTLN
jgi:hypothetical protein